MNVPTLPSLLEMRARETHQRPLLRVLDVERTADELLGQARACGAALRERGVRSGDRVAVMADNCIELVEIWLGCTTIGAIFVPVNTAMRGMQLTHVVNDSEPAAVLAPELYLARMIEAGCPASVQHIWALDANPMGSHEPWSPQLTDGRPSLADTMDSSECGALLYTSGTTGPSKGVECSHAQLYWWGRNTATVLEVNPEDLLYTCLPLFHINALNTVIQCLYTGARAVIGPRFSASQFWTQVTEAEATVTYLLGAMVSILANRDPNEYEPAHRLRVALAPATPPTTWATFEERFGVRIVEGHGMTETNFAIGPRDGEQRHGWMGRVMPGFEARVVDDDDRELPPNTPGELLLRPADRQAFATGYWRHPDATLAAWKGGWFHTGDRVLFDEHGFFRFIDRLKDAIRRRGENISAWEVEQALELHIAVSKAAVVPVPSDLGEDEVLAFVVPVAGAKLEPDALISHCGALLSYFAIPRYVEIVDELPLTETGKVMKTALRELGLRETTWDRERAGIQIKR